MTRLVRSRVIQAPSTSVSAELAAALAVATTAALRGDDPSDVLRALGDRLRSSGIVPGRTPGDVKRLPPSTSGESLSAVPTVSEPPRETPQVARDVVSVFEHWKVATSRPLAKLTTDRISRIRGRLREGYSPETLRKAIDGCAASEFHSGTNDRNTRYDDISLICRSGSTVERFAEMSASSSDYVSPGPVRRTPEQIQFDDETRRLKAEAKLLLREGRTEEYAKAIQSLRSRSDDR